MSEQRRLSFDEVEEVDPLLERDRAARVLAIDPRRNVALEASAGTGKTRVLVDRYVRLLSKPGARRATSWRSPSRARPPPKCGSA